MTDDITFAVIGSKNAAVEGKTGDDGDGTVTFTGLKAGSYLLRETYPEKVNHAFIWSCQSDVRTFDYPFTPFARIDKTGTIKISLVAGETLKCDWFNVPTKPVKNSGAVNPTSGDVEVTIKVFQCPSQTVITSACDPAAEGEGVSLTPTSGDGDPVDLETDDQGVAKGSVPADEYDIDADESICAADSSVFTSDGTLDLTDGDAVDVSVYLCS